MVVVCVDYIWWLHVLELCYGCVEVLCGLFCVVVVYGSCVC